MYRYYFHYIKGEGTPNKNLTFFVCYLKIINTVLKKKTKQNKKKP